MFSFLESLAGSIVPSPPIYCDSKSLTSSERKLTFWSSGLLPARSDSQPVWTRRDDGSAGQFTFETAKHWKARPSLLRCPETHKPNNSGVRPAKHDGQLTEVLVESNEHSPFGMRTPQDLVVSRIHGPIACPDHIVPVCPKVHSRGGRHAAIEEQSQDWACAGNSIRSWPTTR